MELQIHILIVAGGDGKRMGKELPKQFLLLDGKPVLFHTFDSFQFLHDIKFTLVLNSNHIDYWKELCRLNNFNIPHNIAEGGPTRFHSVKSGLKNIPLDSLVLIHDAARPFASTETIIRVIDTASRKGNAIPVTDIEDSVREVSGANNKVIDRNKLKAIQTPQAFHSSIIKEAYNNAYDVAYTDDATVLESNGSKINLVDGNRENIKISNPVDMIIGEGIVDYRKRT